jgi:hypothetical protein
VFDDRQRVTGLPGMIVWGHWRVQNSMVNAERQRFILVRYVGITSYVQSGVNSMLRPTL